MTPSNRQCELLANCLAKHYKTLLGVAGPHAGGPVEAEDIVQQAAMITLGHCDRLRTEAAMVRWLLRVVKRVGLNGSAKRARRAELRAGHVRQHPGSIDPRPLSSEFEERVAEALLAAESLSRDQRRVVHCVLDGLSYKETAAKLDRSVGAVRVLWLRAVQNLRKVLLPGRTHPEEARYRHLRPGNP